MDDQVMNVRDLAGAMAPPPAPEETDEYGRQFNVEIVMIPWKGSRPTTDEDATILVTRNVKVNGHLMEFQSGPEPKDPKLGEVYVVEHGEAKIEIGPFAMISLNKLKPECKAALEVTADDWMEQTTEDTLVLPLSSLTIRTLMRGEIESEPSSY